MRYFHSGINSYALLKMLAEEGVAGMVNANCVMQPAIQRALEDFPELPLVLDSGAYQGESDLESYVDVLRQVHHRFEWCAGLDDLSSQHVTDERYLELTGIYFFNCLWVYQLAGGQPASHIEWARRELLTPGADLIGVGGCVGYARAHGQSALMKRIEDVGRVLKETGLRAHFFGVGSPALLRAFSGADWFASADSSKFLAGKKARKIYRLDGSTINAQKSGLALTAMACAQQNVRQIERWARGAGAKGEQAAPLFQQASFAGVRRSAPSGDSVPSGEAPVVTPRVDGRCLESFQAERGGRITSDRAEAMPAAIGCELYGDRRGVDW